MRAAAIAADVVSINTILTTVSNAVTKAPAAAAGTMPQT